MFVIRMYYARGYIYGVNGIFTQPNISNKGQNSELGWWLYLKWNNHEMLVSWFHDMRWWYHGIMTWPCWFQNWLHQRTHISSNCCTCFGSTYTKIGTIQRRLAWPLRKDDTQNREAFHILASAPPFSEDWSPIQVLTRHKKNVLKLAFSHRPNSLVKLYLLRQ